MQNYRIVPFDIAEKPQGAPGLDIDVQTVDGLRIIPEIKTTTPYKQHDFGAQQWTTIRKDFKQLQSHDADKKYFFVTDPLAYDVLKASKFTGYTAGIELVCLANT